jgi:hypothetical protein
MIHRYRYDALTGRVHNQRTILRNGAVRSFQYSNRIFTFPELRDWLASAGFRGIEGFGTDGSPLTHDNRRMIVRATR